MLFQAALFFLLGTLTYGQNPFADNENWFLPPSYRESLSPLIENSTGARRQTLINMVGVPTAFWIDKKAKLTEVDQILRLARPNQELVVLIVYNLPNRDCSASASNGELCCTYHTNGTCDYLAETDCADGIDEYKTTYIDPLYNIVRRYPTVPIVLVIEPDSTGNLVTNTGQPKCGNATQAAYNAGIPYAVNKFYRLTHVTIYIDAAHGGWLGWGASDFIALIRGWNLLGKIRGFATNVANYNTIGELCPEVGFCLPNQNNSNHSCCYDPCSLASNWNPGHNEANYVARLAQDVTDYDIHFIIDTGRNGQPEARGEGNCPNWCNIKGAGLGLASTTATFNTSVVDAYFWLKTPGESDGCTSRTPDGNLCPRFDTACESVSSIGYDAADPRAPEAGGWFEYQVFMLADNADPVPPTYTGYTPPSPPPQGSAAGLFPIAFLMMLSALVLFS